MTIPCPVCYEEHLETSTLRCPCGGAVDCAGSEGPKTRIAGEVVRFHVTCTTCGKLVMVDTRTGARVGVQEPVIPG